MEWLTKERSGRTADGGGEKEAQLLAAPLVPPYGSRGSKKLTAPYRWGPLLVRGKLQRVEIGQTTGPREMSAAKALSL